MKSLIKTLDLESFISDFESHFAREKCFILQGDSNLHFKRLNELSNSNFAPPPNVKNLDFALTHLSKQGILHLDELAEFVKIFSYFVYLKKQSFGANLNAWLEKIVLSDFVYEMLSFFDKDAKFIFEKDERLININESLRLKNEQIAAEFKRLIYSKSITPYLIDTQIHLMQDLECLLVRGGFNHAIKAKVIARSNGGGFYIFPASCENLIKQKEDLKNEIEQILYEYASKFSAIFSKNLMFLKFINNAFDLFDHYAARVMFAKKHDLEFVLANNNGEIELKDFSHPAIKNAKSVSVSFSKNALIITGVNAGGKSMLLKSIMAASFLAKNLLPMKINASSQISAFKDYISIIEDPQNVKNDISTFAGRMLEFSKLLSVKNILLGVDEIELGTDFEEAACLYSVLINKLIENNVKIIITTHHKRLAMLLGKNEKVELLAALYDEELARPKYEFLSKIIGKSYAFETALRYQIPANLVAKAREIYGEDKQNLEEMIGKNINLEFELKEKLANLANKEEKINQILESLKLKKESFENEYKMRLNALELDFLKAINAAKKTLDFSELKQKQRSINEAHKIHNEIKISKKTQDESFKIGDNVKYEKIKGKIIGFAKNDAIIESDGIKLRVGLNLLKKSGEMPKKQVKTNISVSRPVNLGLSLDLHGLRSDEAIERLDKFISDSLIAGFDEVIVYHGIGTGKLAYAVKEFLKTHKNVKSFSDAPINQGGFGAKLIKL